MPRRIPALLWNTAGAVESAESAFDVDVRADTVLTVNGRRLSVSIERIDTISLRTPY